MAGLLEHDKTAAGAPEGTDAAPPAAPAEPPAAVPAPARTCTTCGAPLAADQDWCLECGSAQPGRLGRRTGWRAALTVVAVTLVLAGGATAAAIAALSSDARTAAQVPPPPAATPQVTPPPAQTAPPAQTQQTQPAQPVPTVKAPTSQPARVPATKAPASKPAQTPSNSGSAGSNAGTQGSTGSSNGTGSTTGNDAAPSEPAPIDLAPDAAATYDPYTRAGGATGDPAEAVDGKASTAWSAPVDAQGLVRVGLVVSLDKARQLSKLSFQADTPGFTVEIYATKSAELPPDVLDSRWEHVSDRRDVGVTEDVALKGRYRHVLLWITEQPADTKVAIPEVQLFA